MKVHWTDRPKSYSQIIVEREEEMERRLRHKRGMEALARMGEYKPH